LKLLDWDKEKTSCKDSVYFIQAHDKKDVILCDKISLKSSKDQCVMDIKTLTNNPTSK